MVKLNVDPSPGELSTHMRPPISSARRLLMLRPSPVPPNRLVVDASTCVKESNISSRRSFGMLIPESTTSKRRMHTPSDARSEEHTSELQSRGHLVCRLLLETKNKSKHD